MIIQGAKYWADKNKLHIQENNAFEILLPGLEYCGPTAAINCIEALYDNIARDKGIKIQLEDYLTAFMLDPNNLEMFNKIRALPYGFGAGKYPSNRIPQIYPYCVKQCFDVDAEYKEEGDYEKIAQLLWNGDAVQLCIPGHFIAALAYDSQINQIGFKDSWTGDRWPTGNSVVDPVNNKWFTKTDFEKIAKWYIWYKRPV
jgi:hypothetical protein